MKTVWLFKSDSPNSSYEELLHEKGFAVKSIPTIEFEYQSKNDINEAFHNPTEFDGIIFTSVRGVQSVSDVFRSLEDSIKKEWEPKMTFVIGKATEKSVKENLNLNCMGSETGNAKQLGEFILVHYKPSFKPLLYICGNLRRDDLSDFLSEYNLKFKQIISYSTVMHNNLENTVSEQLQAAIPNFIAFFSPSGIEFSLPIFRNLKFDIGNINIIALGPTTEKFLMSKQIAVYGVCKEPSPKGLLDVLLASN